MSKKYSEIEKQILREISVFIYDQEKNAARTSSYIKSFGITDIHYEPKHKVNKWNIFEKSTPIVFITLTRPGILIGAKGVLIEALTKWMQEKINKKLKIWIIEN
jgi:hypothetical protein